jgi:hypothetical protein
VLEYRRPDGTVQREYRSPEEVFHADSLASLAGVPVTDLHPPEMVSPANFERFARGHVGDTVARGDGDTVNADVIVNSGSLIGKVDGGSAVEVSCGYECQLDMTPGVSPSGERYDAVQRSIRYNHAALGPRGWGRAGASASLRLDSNGHELPTHQRADSMHTVRIDGVDYDPSTPAFAQAFAKFVESATATAASVSTLTAEVSKQSGRADAAEGVAKDLKAKLDAASAPGALDALVADRVALVGVASKFLPADVKLDGKSADEIKAAVVAHCRPELKLDGKSAEYVLAVFDAVTAVEPAKRTDHTSDLRRSTSSSVATGKRRVTRLDLLTFNR